MFSNNWVDRHKTDYDYIIFGFGRYIRLRINCVAITNCSRKRIKYVQATVISAWTLFLATIRYPLNQK